MLPILNLDDEYYIDVFEKAKKNISSIYPEWTDYNEHDPGITFLQLLSWLKEMQQFHLDQIGKEHLKMFLKILGMTPRKMLPAKTVVEITPLETNFFLPRGAKVRAGEIAFETCCDLEIVNSRITQCICIAQEREIISGELLDTGKKMKIFPFGKNPKAGNEFLIKFDRPLEMGKTYQLYFDIFDDYPVARNPIDEKFYPLAQLELRCYSETGFVVCNEIEDNTVQFLQSGILKFKVPEKMQPMEDDTYGICLCLKECEYDVAPVIQGLHLNVVQVQQTDTVIDYRDFCLENRKDGKYTISFSLKLFHTETLTVYEKCGAQWKEISKQTIKIEFLGENTLLHFSLDSKEEKHFIRVTAFAAHDLFLPEYEMNGFPYQQIELNDKHFVYEDFEIFVEVPEKKGFFIPWEKVENFHNSGPMDCHYRLEEETGKIIFGDCEQAIAPQGRLRVIHCSRSYGIGGNVQKEQIQQFDDKKYNAKVCNWKDVSNGTNQEEIEECFLRYDREFSKVTRAVTEEDYETLVRQISGLRIKNVKVVPTELIKKDSSQSDNCVTVVVEPYSSQERAKLGNLYIKNILDRLNEKRMIGTKVNILSPDYIGVSVYAEIVVKPHYLNAREMIEQTVTRFFEQAGGEFGIILEENTLYGCLDAQECVLKIRNLAFLAQGKGVCHMANGNIQFPKNGLVYLKQADYVITAGSI